MPEQVALESTSPRPLPIHPSHSNFRRTRQCALTGCVFIFSLTGLLILFGYVPFRFSIGVRSERNA